MRIARAITVAVVLAAPHAAAEPSQTELKEARDLFAQAERDERAGDFASALDKLRRVAQIKVTPGIRFHIALSEEKTGQLVLALQDYAQAEKQATDEKNREVLAALKEPMERLRARIPRVIVRVPPDIRGVELLVDGKALAAGYFGAEVPVESKSHTIEARAPGRRTFHTSIVTPEREITTVDVVLEEEAKPAPFPPPPAPQPSANGRPPAVSPQRESSAPEASSSGGKTGTILATAGSLALAGVGVAAFFVADGQQGDASRQCKIQVDCEALRGPVRTWDAVALGSWIGAGALGTIAVVLWLTPDASKRSARVIVGPGSAGIAGGF